MISFNKRKINNILFYVKLWVVASAVSFIFIEVIGFGDPQDSSMDYTLFDFFIDCMVMFVLIGSSILFNKLFINILKPLQHYQNKIFIYSLLLLVTNFLMALFIVKILVLIFGVLPRQEFIKTVYLFSLIATLVSGIHANVLFQDSYRRQSQQKHKLELDNIKQRQINLQTSLIALNTQIDPHFLFNNLSILSDLIEEDVKDAQLFLKRLSEVYRYRLTNMNTDVVDIKRELQMVSSFVYLLSTRFGNALQIKLPPVKEIEDMHGMGVPPFAIQTLVENAVKHNAHSTVNPLVILVEINLVKRTVVVSNPLQPLSSDICSTKIGLENLSARYNLLNQREPIIQNDGKVFKVTLPLINL